MAKENRLYRRLWLQAHGAGPWPCADCGEPVEWANCHIHHKDEDRKNNALSNLEVMHGKCHNRMHSKARDMTHLREIRWSIPGAKEEWARKMAERGTRVPCSVCEKPIIHWHMERHMRSHARD